MASPRILVGPLPRLLRDLVCRLAGAACVEAAGASLDTLVDEAARLGAQVVVAQIDRDETAMSTSCRLSARVPGGALVNIDPRGVRASRYVAGDLVARAEDLSPDGLRALLEA